MMTRWKAAPKNMFLESLDWAALQLPSSSALRARNLGGVEVEHQVGEIIENKNNRNNGKTME